MTENDALKDRINLLERLVDKLAVLSLANIPELHGQKVGAAMADYYTKKQAMSR